MPIYVILDRCNGICNTTDDLSSRIYVLNKTDDVNLNAFDKITGTNESRTLTKKIFRVTVKVKLIAENVIQIKSGITICVRVDLKSNEKSCVQKRLCLGP